MEQDWILYDEVKKALQAKNKDLKFLHLAAGNSPYAAFDLLVWDNNLLAGRKLFETPCRYIISAKEIKTVDPAIAYRGRHGCGRLIVCTPNPDGWTQVPSNGDVRLELADGTPIGVQSAEIDLGLEEHVWEQPIIIRNRVIWASVHNPTSEQLAELHERYEHVDMLADRSWEIAATLIAITPDTDLVDLAAQLIQVANTYDADICQPAGNPAFQFVLGVVRGLDPVPAILYADSKRESVEQTLEDGTISKLSIFRHLGFRSL
jgi:hypothetical protein